MAATTTALAVREDRAELANGGEEPPAPTLIDHTGGLQLLAEMTNIKRVSGRSLDYYCGEHPTLGVIALALTVAGECLLWAGRVASLCLDVSPFV